MDEIIKNLLSTVSTLTASVDRLEAAVSKQSGITERVVAAQETAIARMDAQGSAPTTRRRAAAGKPADPETPAAVVAETPAAAPEPKHPLLAAPNGEIGDVADPKTGELKKAPTVNYRAADFGRDEVKNEFMGWLGETVSPDVRKERGAFVAAVSQHFGVKLPFHPTEGITDDETRKQALFFLRRKREGLKVDFGADYNFDADPPADQATDAEGDGMDALG